MAWVLAVQGQIGLAQIWVFKTQGGFENQGCGLFPRCVRLHGKYKDMLCQPVAWVFAVLGFFIAGPKPSWLGAGFERMHAHLQV